MLSLLKGPAVAAGLPAATVTGIVFARTGNDYAIAYDTLSGRWSNPVPVDSSCASL